MRFVDGIVRLSATDVANHLACRHLTALDLGAAAGRWQPPDFYRPEAAVLAERGLAHEHAYLLHLEAGGRRVTRLADDDEPARAIDRTLAAMRAGADAIAQATLADGRWFGRADLLLRVDRPGAFGDWSYEPLDTKLARETKGGAILQLCLYCELLAAMQGVAPEHLHVVPGHADFPLESYRVADYLAYYRLVRRRLEAASGANGSGGATYPEPVPHCDVCRWWPRCDGQRRADDHLSLVAGISRLQVRELESRDVTKLAALARVPLPLAWKPARGSREGLVRVREQARIQLAGREAGRCLHELLPFAPARGLACLPAPSPGDLFLDLEADPYVGEGGLEYLFGWAVADPPPEGTLALEPGPPVYHARWATDRGAEKAAFEALVDTIMDRWARDPGMHVYHYAAYEPGAIKRLMGRHATREAEVDRLLRSDRFVDLHGIAKQSLRASVEEYSIKRLEPLYAFTRAQPLDAAGTALRVLARALELGVPVDVAGQDARTVEAYNRDDCLSAHALREWLERLRDAALAAGAPIERPRDGRDAPNAEIGERERRARALAERLFAGVPDDPAARTPEQHATWLLGHLLDWHRREEKAGWWEYFRLRELPDDELLDETGALAGLEFAERLPAKGRTALDRYRFPPQETKVRRGDTLHVPNPDCREFGSVEAIDLVEGVVDVKKRMACTDHHPTAVFAHDEYRTEEQFESLMRLGTWVADHGIDAPGAWRAARDLLLRHAPRFAGAPRRDGADVVARGRALAAALDHSTLPVQGPPGSGKTYLGARMIAELVRRGQRVGVCATSHKVIRNLLSEVVHAGLEDGVAVRCLHKLQRKSDVETPGIAEAVRDGDVLDQLASGRANVVGGTAWLWAGEPFTEAVDALFVDEAGQMSLANVLAIAGCARSVVLLGDPQQLEQPTQGSHPDGTDVSALEHVLGGAATIATDRGLFLEETWRLAPAICAFTSEQFYDGRLRPHAGLEHQALVGGPFAGAGTWFVPVDHDANQAASAEEVDTIAAIVAALTDGGVRWRDPRRDEHAVGLDDVLVIAPYNAQVADLTHRLPAGARVGTVDRFQGQQAAVVIYSMTTSTPQDAPRGMEFLYSANRFNVATSRARCACIVVGSPRLFEPDCRTPATMKLANPFCRYLEVATEAASPAAAAAPRG